MPQARLTVWGEAECRRLHEATLELLADTGVEVRYEPALELFRAAGARSTAARAPPGRLVDEALASAPREWLVKPRGGDTAPLVLRDGRSTSAPARTALRVRPRDARAPPGARRRRGHGGALREAAQHRLRHDHGPARGRAAGGRRPGPGRGDAEGHAQAAAPHAERRRACWRACRRWRRSAARRRASPSTPCRRRRSCTTPRRSPR